MPPLTIEQLSKCAMNSGWCFPGSDGKSANLLRYRMIAPIWPLRCLRDASGQQTAQIDEYPVTADHAVGIEVEKHRSRIALGEVIEANVFDGQLDSHATPFDVVSAAVKAVLHRLDEFLVLTRKFDQSVQTLQR